MDPVLPLFYQEGSCDAIYNKTPITIYEDNQGMIKLANNPINHLKMKH